MSESYFQEHRSEDVEENMLGDLYKANEQTHVLVNLWHVQFLRFAPYWACKPGHSWSDGHIAESCDRQRSAGRALFSFPTCFCWALAGIISVTTDLNHLHSFAFFTSLRSFWN